VSRPEAPEPCFIWATRGRSWGFKFLRDGGFDDPLPHYEAIFAAIADEPEAWCRVVDRVALRFPDPDRRRDDAGRVIPHDFVLIGSWADEVDSVETGIALVWPVVAEEFGRVWDSPHPPTPSPR
jgi:hypothetical protein